MTVRMKVRDICRVALRSENDDSFTTETVELHLDRDNNLIDARFPDGKTFTSMELSKLCVTKEL